MKNDKKIEASIHADKELLKRVNKSYYVNEQNSITHFIRDVRTYIKAIEEGRMLCIIRSVSKSGMSRVIKFNSSEKGKERKYWFRQYCALFDALGYTPAKNDRDAYRIGGCGMDMVFHTNYSNMHKFERLGFITKEECGKLAQMTPTVL